MSKRMNPRGAKAASSTPRSEQEFQPAGVVEHLIAPFVPKKKFWKFIWLVVFFLAALLSVIWMYAPESTKEKLVNWVLPPSLPKDPVSSVADPVPEARGRQPVGQEKPVRASKTSLEAGVLKELREKKLLGKIAEASEYSAANSPEGLNEAMKLYLDVVHSLSNQSKSKMNQNLLLMADSNYQMGYYDAAVGKYKQVFSPYLRREGTISGRDF